VGEFRAVRRADGEHDRHVGNSHFDRLLDRNVKG